MAIKKRFYSYSVIVAQLAVGGSADKSFNIESDSHFILQKMTFTADIAGASQTDSSRVLPLVTMMVVDSGSARQMMDAPLPIPALMGTGQLPYILPVPHKFSANSTVSVALSNYGVVIYNLYLVFSGIKVW